MEPTVLIGVVLSIGGLYTLLTRRTTSAADTTDLPGALLDRLTSRTATGFALTLTGLLIVTAVESRPATWWGPSILDGPVPTGVYWFGIVALLAGAVAVAFAESDRTAFCGIVLVGAGGALLFGLVGDLVAGIALIMAAAVGGWAIRFLPALPPFLPNSMLRSSAPESAVPDHPEPLLLTVALVAILVLSASTLHRAATRESPLTESHETGERTLPRPAVSRARLADAAVTSDDSGPVSPDAFATPSDSRQWHSVAVYSLLILVVAVGVWQQSSRCNRSPEELRHASCSPARLDSQISSRQSSPPSGDAS
ncbi:hypothetical protein GC176_10210 [bacterium]|nr:hypothetical protein [bacterium]